MQLENCWMKCCLIHTIKLKFFTQIIWKNTNQMQQTNSQVPNSYNTYAISHNAEHCKIKTEKHYMFLVFFSYLSLFELPLYHGEGYNVRGSLSLEGSHMINWLQGKRADTGQVKKTPNDETGQRSVNSTLSVNGAQPWN